MALAIITGASRGIGRARSLKLKIALEGAKSLSLNHIVLLSRSKEGLEDTRKQLAASHPSLTSSQHEIDFSDIDHLESNINNVFKELNPAKYKQVYLFSNHGTLEKITQIRNITNFLRIKKDVDTNLTSIIILSSLALQHFSPKSLPTPPQLFLINTSTLAAVKPFEAWGIYCSERAGRDMLHAVIAAEEDKQLVKTLNYAPGPCDTDMQKQVREEAEHAPTREFYSGLHSKGQLVDVHTSVQKLMKLLVENKFESGAHLDYYDL